MDTLWLIPALPLAAFLAILLGGRAMPPRLAGAISTAAAAAATALAGALAWGLATSPPPGDAYASSHWTWIAAGNFVARAGLYLDPLSAVMIVVVTLVSTLILLYSTEFMAGDEGCRRFFLYMSLFVAMMLLLVLADNLLFVYLAWEGVGLCSYLLIAFWQHDLANVRAGQKAFIVTRVGDAALLVGILLLLTHMGTLDIPSVLRAAQAWPVGSALAVAAAALVLAGAVGKSAQVPLHTWLPDAMAGPTPVSALIHAATMVAAGMYLLARLSPLLARAPQVQMLVAVVGAVTLLYAAFSAMVQRDVKRVLAYSTMSQVGYMFLALGVGSASAAVFHFVTHALFKSLLFLAAGSVMLALRQEHDLSRMGGLRKAMPLTFWTFLVAAAGLSALPLVTGGFFSKDAILWAAWTGGQGGKILWAAGLGGAVLTAVYTFRMVFLIFFGPRQQQPRQQPGPAMRLAMVVLAALTVASMALQWPAATGGTRPMLEAFLRGTFERFAASPAARAPTGTQAIVQGAAAAAALAGLWLAYVLFLRRRDLAAALARVAWGARLERFWLAGWGFDWFYDRVLVRPVQAAARAVRHDAVDAIYAAIAQAATVANWALAWTVNGRLRWYFAGIVLGAIFLLAVAVLR